MYFGRDFKRDIELDNLKVYASNLRPKRSWIDLFSLSLSNNFCFNKFNFTTLTDKLSEDEVIIIDSHDNIFNAYQIHFWRKASISNIFPAIKCPSFKSKTKIFKTSEMKEIREFINNKIRTKSIVIENKGDTISINLVYGNIIKIMPITTNKFQQTKYFDELKERYNLWEIDDCACKPKKIRVWVYGLKILKYTVEELEKISSINDAKLGVY